MSSPIKGSLLNEERFAGSRRGTALLAAVLLLSVARAAHPDELLTLDAALQEARAANARLPVARTDVRSSQARLSEARARRWPAVSAEGDLRYAAPTSAFPDNGSEERLELFVRGPIYSGGALGAGIAVAEANVAGSAARYRVAEADLELELRVRFSAVIEARSELSVQQEGVERLGTYLESVRARKRSGQGLEADLLKTEAELATQRVAAAAAELRLGEARHELNDLLGRDPRAPLAVAPLPEPTAPPQTEDGEPWLVVPDLKSAAAEIDAAGQAIAVTRAERKPHLSFEVGGGYLGLADPRRPGDPFGQRVLRGFGFSLMLSYDWTLFDFGAYDARLALAQLDLQRARDSRLVAYRGARLEWDRARLRLTELYRQLQLFAEAVPRSRDAYLAAESLYRGGAGTALGVLDAFRTWVDAAVGASQALLAYRTAEARYLRWGSP